MGWLLAEVLWLLTDGIAGAAAGDGVVVWLLTEVLWLLTDGRAGVAAGDGGGEAGGGHAW